MPRFRLSRDLIFWIVAGAALLIYGLLRRDPVNFVAALVSLLVAITIHESAHAWMADRLGDPTARLLGRVSLNPLVHLDPLGTAMMVMTVVTGVGIGWGKPVPVSPYRLRYGARLGNGLVALAGPGANLSLAIFFGLALRLAPPLPGWLGSILATVVLTNLVLAFFNLLPLPPLDGSSVLLGLLSLIRARWAWAVMQFVERVQQYGPIVLIGVILLAQFVGLDLIGMVIWPPTSFMYHLLLGGQS
jgi:Zn-dependent protease